jgi:biotin carboxyl carrier protein
LTFEIEINGTTRTVSVERGGAPGRFRVAVDGRAIEVDAQRSGEYGLSLLFPEPAHAGAAVQLAPGPTAGSLLASLAGRSVAVTVNGRRGGHRATETSGAAHGEQKVIAPRPGRVVRVLVAAGDLVEARQPIVVVEAMKMENELRSPKAGRIKDVGVAAGASVEAGRVLVVVE